MKNYSRRTEAQKQRTVSTSSLKGDILFESAEDANDWMQRLANKIQEKQDKEKNEIN